MQIRMRLARKIQGSGLGSATDPTKKSEHNKSSNENQRKSIKIYKINENH